jgi:hypothetical protein
MGIFYHEIIVTVVCNFSFFSDYCQNFYAIRINMEPSFSIEISILMEVSGSNIYDR